uniref:Putative secreted metalloprotease n=1 Tax=Ixodes ricinus TaxID=34613 RepID=A0A6B0VAL9_IXORI
MKAWLMFMALGGIILEANTISREQVITLGVRFVCDTWIVKSRQDKHHTTALQDYLKVFLNDVELYLKESRCPQIQLFLTGVYETKEAEEILFEKTEREGTKTILDPTFTLGLFQEWVQTKDDFKNDSIVFLLTSLMIEDRVGNGISKKGYSYFNGVCSLGVGIAYDSGYRFDGVIYVAQQIAHMLGSPWDTTNDCPENKRTLMAAPGTPHRLSNCTEEALRKKYNENVKKDVCWKKFKNLGSSSDRSLPADYFENENYCATRNKIAVHKCPVGHPYNIEDLTKCWMGCCFNNTTDASGLRYEVPDGTPCESEKICIAWECSAVQ